MKTSRSHNEFDVAILGSGFGGSLLAAILSAQGQAVCLLDRGSHPRFAIGESSTPAADMILHQLVEEYGLHDLLPLCRFGTWQASLSEIRCGCKRGFSYFWHGAPDGYQTTATHEHEMLVAASSGRDVADTQWYRADVDQFLCQYAVERGAVLFDRSCVSGFQHLRTGDWSIEFERDQQRECVRARFVVDASGDAAVLLHHLKVQDHTRLLNTSSSAVFSHFEHVPKVQDWLAERNAPVQDFPFPADDAAVHHLFTDGWLWQLRFEDGPTSVGFVSPHFDSERRCADQVWKEVLESHPVLQELLDGARPAPIPGKVIQSGRLQKLFARGAGEDWAALPFTMGFIDPLHSTGIAQTLMGVKRLAAILTSPERNQRRQRLCDYEESIRREVFLIDRLVSGCYASLHDFKRFAAWSMLYFAAATTFEQRFHSGSKDFLCAGDDEFFSIVGGLHDELIGRSPGDQQSVPTSRFVKRIREAIVPFNSVGLFTPEIPNMYAYTAAEK